MHDMIIKSVDLMGDTVMAAQDSNGIIWVAVRWMCNALDMTEGQMKRQIKNIQEDELFSGSGSNQILNKGSGERDVFCLKLDYVPLWLAKINITQKTREERPEFSKKLLEYQLKAKDILAAAFLPKQENTGDVQGQIKLLAQGTTELYEKVELVTEDVKKVKEEIERLKDDLPLFPNEAEEISNAAKKKGVEVLGGKQSNAYNNRSLQHKVYSNIYANLKYNFDVTSYKAIKRGNRTEALRIVQNYQPPYFLAEQIRNENAQQTLDLEGGAVK